MAESESSHDVNLSKESELTPEQKGRQKIVEHLKDAGLESARFQAFADYADLQHLASRWTVRDVNRLDGLVALTMVEETIRQRRNGGIRGYKAEFDSLEEVVSDYKLAMFDKKPEGYISYLRSADARKDTKQFNFATKLQEIKDQEIDRKSREATPPQ